MLIMTGTVARQNILEAYLDMCYYRDTQEDFEPFIWELEEVIMPVEVAIV